MSEVIIGNTVLEFIDKHTGEVLGIVRYQVSDDTEYWGYSRYDLNLQKYVYHSDRLSTSAGMTLDIMIKNGVISL